MMLCSKCKVSIADAEQFTIAGKVVCKRCQPLKQPIRSDRFNQAIEILQSLFAEVSQERSMLIDEQACTIVELQQQNRILKQGVKKYIDYITPATYAAAEIYLAGNTCEGCDSFHDEDGEHCCNVCYDQSNFRPLQPR